MTDPQNSLTAPDRRGLVQDVEAECAVLGCVLAGESDAARDLAPEAFTGARRHVWEAMSTLLAERVTVDTLTVAERLKVRGKLAECGGPAALMGLGIDVLTHNLPAYVAICRDRMQRRAYVAAAEELKAQAENLGSPASKASGACVAALHGAASPLVEDEPDVDVRELAEQWFAFMDRPDGGLDDGVLLKTGIEVLDTICGGMPANLVALLGLASMGKTAMAAEIIWNWLKGGVAGGIIGLESGTSWLTRRHLSRFLGLPVGLMGRTRLHEHQMVRLEQWMGSASEMYRESLRIHRAGGLASADLLTIVRRWISEGVGPRGKKKRCRWVWVDHGLRIRYGSADQRRYDLAIGATLDELSSLGEANGVVVAVNWHLNRTSEQNLKPTINQGKESGYLEAAARWMGAVWEQPQRPGIVLCTGLKVTEGPRDWTAAIERDGEHALVKSTGGYRVDFEAEAADERARTQEAKRERSRKSPDIFARPNRIAE